MNKKLLFSFSEINFIYVFCDDQDNLLIEREINTASIVIKLSVVSSLSLTETNEGRASDCSL